jgi:hypothetical protein
MDTRVLQKNAGPLLKANSSAILHDLAFRKTHTAARCSSTNKIIRTVHVRNAELEIFEKVVQQVKSLLKSLFLLQLNISLTESFFFVTI